MSIRVDIIRHRPSRPPELQGSIRLDASGHAVFDPAVADIAHINVLEPGHPPVLVKPEDGERYLRALPYEFRSGYTSAHIVEG